MNLALRFVAAVVLIASAIVPASAHCAWNRIIWATQQDSERWVLYFEDSISDQGTKAFLELWEDRKIKLRMYGLMVCSQGQTVCRLLILDDHYTAEAFYSIDQRLPGPDVVGEAIIEDLDSDSDGDLDFLVLGGLRQSLFYGLQPDFRYAEVFETGHQGEPHPLHSNVFAFFGCRHSDLDPTEYKAAIGAPTYTQDTPPLDLPRGNDVPIPRSKN